MKIKSMNQILMRLLQMMHLKSRSRRLKRQPITLPNSRKDGITGPWDGRWKNQIDDICCKIVDNTKSLYFQLIAIVEANKWNVWEWSSVERTRIKRVSERRIYLKSIFQRKSVTRCGEMEKFIYCYCDNELFDLLRSFEIFSHLENKNRESNRAYSAH